MSMPPDFDAIVLAGGLGTRLRSVVADRPKPLAPVAGRPFLDHVLAHLAEVGVQRVVLSIGYLGAQIEARYGDRFQGMSITYSRESEPLGTGGALSQALSCCNTPYALALNGDTLLRCDPRGFVARTVASGKRLGILTREVEDAGRYGRCELRDGTVVAFGEKTQPGPGLINAGVYCLHRGALADHVGPARFSFERDFVGPQVLHLRPYAEKVEGYFIDIGVPEDLARAQVELPPWR